jgi:hypothetical protein
MTKKYKNLSPDDFTQIQGASAFFDAALTNQNNKTVDDMIADLSGNKVFIATITDDLKILPSEFILPQHTFKKAVKHTVWDRYNLGHLVMQYLDYQTNEDGKPVQMRREKNMVEIITRVNPDPEQAQRDASLVWSAAGHDIHNLRSRELSKRTAQLSFPHGVKHNVEMKTALAEAYQNFIPNIRVRALFLIFKTVLANIIFKLVPLSVIHKLLPLISQKILNLFSNHLISKIRRNCII